LNTLSSKNDGMSNGDADSKGGLESESVKPVNGNPAQADSKNGGNQTGSSLLNVLADVALTKEKKPGKSKNGYGGAVKGGEAVDGAATAIGSDGESDLPSDEEEGGEHFSTLRELLIRPAPKTSTGKSSEQNAAPVAKRQRMETLEDVISCVIERGVDREPSPEASASATAAGAAGPSPNSSTANATTTAPGKDSNGEPEEVAVDVELVHFKRRGDALQTVLSRGLLPARIMVLSESLKAYPEIPHSWLCTGKLLRLHDPSNPNNYKLFQVG
jgi:lysine-specific demethylase 3